MVSLAEIVFKTSFAILSLLHTISLETLKSFPCVSHHKPAFATLALFFADEPNFLTLHVP